MGTYSQAERPIRVDTTLGEDVLLLEGFEGEEAVSGSFRYTLDLLSEEESIAPDDILRTPVLIRTLLSDGSSHAVHGLVNRFVQLGRVENLTSYQAEVVPWTWFLGLSTECRIFQNVSVLDIVQKVFKDRGYSDFDVRCVHSYPSREYCVQYRETHLDFVARLLEDEGIFTFFEHSDDKHVLVLADDNSAFKPGEQPTVRLVAEEGPWQEEDVITVFRREHLVRPAGVRLRDYNYLKPSLNLEASIESGKGEERYDYPGSYGEPSEGERYARIILESQRATGETIEGGSNVRAFRSGTRFKLKEHYAKEANQDYVLTSVFHTVRAGDYRTWDSAPFDYRNRFVAIPHATPYRPPRTTSKPMVRGSQTAVVVGKAGEEIWVDKHGRIKVQFHWDREGKRDENSSCWVRVATTWAGKGWGSIQIPRIGQEVVVDFLEGDPDSPLVTGSVYNGEQSPPMGMPQGGMKSGMISRSTKGGGGYNEISIDDSKGKEGMTIHAQYDRNTTVENDDTLKVNNNRSGSIAVDDSLKVGSNQSIQVGANQTISVGGNRSASISGNDNLSVTGNHGVSVSGSESVSVSGPQTVTVGGAQTVEVGGAQSTKVGAAYGLKVGAAATVQASGPVTIEGAAVVKINAGASITLSAGGSTIDIGPGGITISTGGIITESASMIKHNA